MEKLYLIKLYKRTVKIVPFGREKCMEIDGIGFFVEYDKEPQLTPENLRRYLTEISHTKCIVPAPSVEEAIRKFHHEWYGANIGSPERYALWINSKEPILELPHCALLHTNVNDEFICGEKSNESNNGEYGMCVLQGYDFPDFCPLRPFFNIIDEYSGILERKIIVDGEKYTYFKSGSLFRRIRNIQKHPKDCEGCDRCMSVA